MAIIEGYDETAMQEWLATRPPVIQELAKLVPPGRLYRLKNAKGELGSRVYVHAYNENGTLTVTVSGEYNLVVFDRDVFGIKPEDLEECDLPSAEERLGTLLTEDKDVHAFLDKAREFESGGEK